MMFKSHHTEWLEAEIERLRQDHREEIARLEKTHEEEMKRAITEISDLRDNIQRLQVVLHPAVQQVELPKERDASPPPTSDKEPVFTGTPWQKVLQREMWLQNKDQKHQYLKPAPVEGAPDAVRQGRDTPS